MLIWNIEKNSEDAAFGAPKFARAVRIVSNFEYTVGSLRHSMDIAQLATFGRRMLLR